MKLSQKQLDQIALGIQAVLATLILVLSVRNSAKVQTAQMQKLSKKIAKQYRKNKSA